MLAYLLMGIILISRRGPFTNYDPPSLGDLGHAFNKRLGLNPVSMILTGGESGRVAYDEHIEEPLSDVAEEAGKYIGIGIAIGLLYLALK